MKKILPVLFCFLLTFPSNAQTAFSLFLHNDKKQVAEIGTDGPVAYELIGHHGPAVENSHMALRIYYNDSGAIDLYSKSGKFMELEKYHWYPTQKQQKEDGAGCDEYLAGKTVGFGGIALWDSEKEVRPVATSGRIARVGKTKRGSFCEVIDKGVMMDGKSYDISIRIDVFDGSRYARVTATSLSGGKVRFATGINYHPGEDLRFGEGWISVWGVHPADVSMNPCPVGAGMRFKQSRFTDVVKTSNTLRIVTRKPVRKVSTMIVGSSVKDDTLPDVESFVTFLKKRRIFQSPSWSAKSLYAGSLRHHIDEYTFSRVHDGNAGRETAYGYQESVPEVRAAWPSVPESLYKGAILLFCVDLR